MSTLLAIHSRRANAIFCAATILALGACAEPSAPSVLSELTGEPSLASSAPPEHLVISFQDQFMDPELCGSFPVLTSLDVTMRISRQLQPRTGLLRQMHVYPSFRVTLEAFGKTLSSRVAGADKLLLDENENLITGAIMGLGAAFTVPGHGIVLLDAGKLVFVNSLNGPPVWERGVHQLFGSQPDASAICAYFAG